MGQYTEYKYFLTPDHEIVLTLEHGAFVPTGTTKVLIKAVQRVVSGPVTMLDLGCGSGIVGLALHLSGLVKAPLFASDLSGPSVRCSRINFERYRCAANLRTGSLFEPWLGHKFDVIIDDISGISQEIAAVSSWFRGVPCESGRDGTALVVEIIRKAPQYLTNHGKFFFPIISLSNVDILLNTAKEKFNTVERVSRQEWPLPDELKIHMPLLERLHDEGSIRLHKRFGMVLWSTEIYCASNI